MLCEGKYSRLRNVSNGLLLFVFTTRDVALQVIVSTARQGIREIHVIMGSALRIDSCMSQPLAVTNATGTHLLNCKSAF